jgi:GT2 family glycosyltransferase
VKLTERKQMKYKVENSREPYGTPFGPGSLFAIRADEFWRLGGYDKGPYVWGGENTEMAFTMWMYGGRMLMVPAHASVTCTDSTRKRTDEGR